MTQYEYRGGRGQNDLPEDKLYQNEIKFFEKNNGYLLFEKKKLYHPLPELNLKLFSFCSLLDFLERKPKRTPF